MPVGDPPVPVTEQEVTFIFAKPAAKIPKVVPLFIESVHAPEVPIVAPKVMFKQVLHFWTAQPPSINIWFAAPAMNIPESQFWMTMCPPMSTVLKPPVAICTPLNPAVDVVPSSVKPSMVPRFDWMLSP